MTNVTSIGKPASQDRLLSNEEKLKINTLQGQLEGTLRSIQAAFDVMGKSPETLDMVKKSLTCLVDDFVMLSEDSGSERAIAIILLNSKNHLVTSFLAAREQHQTPEGNHGEN